MAVYLSAGVIFAVALLLEAKTPGIVKDDGAIQIATVVLLMGNVVFAAHRTWRARGPRLNLGLIAYILVFYAMREADLHRPAMYPEHIANRRFFTAAEVPVLDKVFFGLLLLSLLVCIILFLVRITPSFLRALRRTEDWAVYAGFWFVTLLLTQLSDKSFLNEHYYGQALEEVGELAAAGVISLIVWRFPGARRTHLEGSG
jgi:hypothetical protein